MAQPHQMACFWTLYFSIPVHGNVLLVASGSHLQTIVDYIRNSVYYQHYSQPYLS